jgi:hypothetical protein
MASRKTTHYTLDPSEKVEKFDLSAITSKNIVNHLLVATYDDITFSVIMELFAGFGGKSKFHPYDTMDVPPNTYKYFDPKKNKEVSNTKKFTTTLGIWIYNIKMIRDFGFAFLTGYVNETVGKKQFGKYQQTLAFALLENKINIQTYKKFLDTANWFMAYETVLSPNHTEAVLTCTKKLNIKKKELAKKYKEQLDKGDIAASEKMEKELLNYAAEILKDDPGLDPLTSGAGGDWSNNFKNLYVMRGAVPNPDPNAKQKFDVALSSYIDGISAEEYSVVGNTLAKGAYGRAKKTETGGYWENLVSDATSTLSIDPVGSDCGTKKYGEVYIDPDDYISYMYNYIIKDNGQLEELTSDNISQYLGKTVKMRLAIYCKSKTGFCHHCAGNFFYRRGSNKAGLALSLIPNKLKLISLKSFHDSTVKTNEIDVQKAFFG